MRSWFPIVAQYLTAREGNGRFERGRLDLLQIQGPHGAVTKGCKRPASIGLSEIGQIFFSVEGQVDRLGPGHRDVLDSTMVIVFAVPSVMDASVNFSPWKNPPF